MPRFRVSVPTMVWVSTTVEADEIDDAYDKTADLDFTLQYLVGGGVGVKTRGFDIDLSEADFDRATAEEVKS